jgi:hypothetical protein
MKPGHTARRRLVRKFLGVRGDVKELQRQLDEGQLSEASLAVGTNLAVLRFLDAASELAIYEVNNDR